MNNIMEVMADIQARLVAPKDQFNKFGKYRYRSAESILEALKPLLKEHGAFVTMDDGVQDIQDRVYVVSTAAIHWGGETLTAMAYAREEPTKKGMDAAQITGSASSYARKFALSGLFAIDDGGDPDQIDGAKPEAKRGMTKEEKDAVHFQRKVRQTFDLDTIEDLQAQYKEFLDEAKELGLLDWMKAEYKKVETAINAAAQMDGEAGNIARDVIESLED